MKILSNYRNLQLGAGIIATLFLATHTQANDKLAPLQPSPSQKKVSIEIVSQLKLKHYRYLNVDDGFSTRLLDTLIDNLDPNRSYFLSSDIDEFEKYRYNLDNALNKGDVRPGFVLYNRFRQRLSGRLEWLLTQLEGGIEQFNFNKDETIKIDREEAEWAQSPAELDEFWRKRLKNSVLERKLAKKQLDKITETLAKRYRNQLKRIHQNNSDDVFQYYMNTVSQAYDPHTEYLAPRRSENFNIDMSLSLEGIGAVLQTDNEHTKVVRLVPGGPADKANELKPTDLITGVAQGEDGELVDVVGWRLDEVVDLIRGDKGTTVRLQLMPGGVEDYQQAKEIKIVRNRVLLEEQAAQKKLLTLNNGDRDYKVGVIDIPKFYADFAAYQAGDPNYKSTTRDVHKLLEELKKEDIDGLVIDLRNNGGGALSEASSLVGLFIRTGATVQIQNLKRRTGVLRDTNPLLTYEGPLVVLVNRLSASASEIFAGAIQDYQRGLIVGGQTFGKGTVQTLVPLEKDGQLKITESKFYRISGQSTQYQGVIPDINFPPLLDIEKIGENTLEGALPLDSIRPVNYSLSGDIAPLVSKLSDLHDARVATNPDYQYRLARIEQGKKNSDKQQWSLKESDRKKEQEDFKAWQLATENERRVAKGLEPLAKLDDKEEGKNKDPEAIDDQDPYLLESGHILTDYIRLNQPRVAKH